MLEPTMDNIKNQRSIAKWSFIKLLPWIFFHDSRLTISVVCSQWSVTITVRIWKILKKIHFILIDFFYDSVSSFKLIHSIFWNKNNWIRIFIYSWKLLVRDCSRERNNSEYWNFYEKKKTLRMKVLKILMLWFVCNMKLYRAQYNWSKSW